MIKCYTNKITFIYYISPKHNATNLFTCYIYDRLLLRCCTCSMYMILEEIDRLRHYYKNL